MEIFKVVGLHRWWSICIEDCTFAFIVVEIMNLWTCGSLNCELKTCDMYFVFVEIIMNSLSLFVMYFVHYCNLLLFWLICGYYEHIWVIWWWKYIICGLIAGKSPESVHSRKNVSTLPSITIGIGPSGRVRRILHSAKMAPRCHSDAWFVALPRLHLGTRRRL